MPITDADINKTPCFSVAPYYRLYRGPGCTTRQESGHPVSALVIHPRDNDWPRIAQATVLTQDDLPKHPVTAGWAWGGWPMALG
jgi:hypothetical protein